ncbi:H+/gluconate symporter-like permease [Clostridium tetanomorphum]|uniref:TRAP transporter large permease subunit n=1 Tax=Clostridium tetanomorphum TaxID=1553 RepID=A0A923E9H0_CLOTT|nr:Na+/H+ antiporter NhaC family protein [Clostridium tetanomorphum]KAJ50617.1 citrate transporter [Clostridium tetanomorphum DSM 665]MBC2399077.1 TRAP transporter large permease subunit [Clostridium tetanomorphum]MBP1862692.1 H+/gluconate symporter-like permease [Clostridium tetanomorphum]NRS85468.1 H+/gluconate symporter-like permease [Clostridium tetanomorphum]NRZ98582.1 H+/gluconate symporter-like permease [Clostridium tetanomorphum]
MLFGMSPLVALLPLILYIIFAFKDINPILNVLVCVIITAILTNKPLLGMGSVIAESLGSFLSLVGFIIMLGSALGAILKKTGVAENIVRTVMKKIGINTEKKAVLAAMATSMILTALLGTLAGANAIIAPIVIPLVAAIGITPSCLSAIFMGAGLTGLFIGPFSPQVVTIMGLTGLSYGQYLVAAGLPVTAVCLIITYIMSNKIQKDTKGVYAYENVESIDVDKQVTNEVKKATYAFLITLTLLIIYGIYVKSGASYAVVVMFVAAIVTGISAKLKLNDIFETLVEGASRMMWLFIMFVLFNPFITFIEESGAFKALVDLLKPLLASGNKIVFSLVSTLTGIFGIGGAAVAQSVVMDKMFKGFVESLGISTGLWAMIILVGSQITSFAYPEADMLGQMGLARSKDLKNMVKFGVTVVIANVLLIFVRAFFG